MLKSFTWKKFVDTKTRDMTNWSYSFIYPRLIFDRVFALDSLDRFFKSHQVLLFCINFNFNELKTVPASMIFIANIYHIITRRQFKFTDIKDDHIKTRKSLQTWSKQTKVCSENNKEIGVEHCL